MAHADQIVFAWINGWVGSFPPFDSAMRWVVSDYLVPVSLVLTLTALWFSGGTHLVRQRYQLGVLVALSSMGLASGFVLLLNEVYFRPRPFEDIEVSLLFYQPTDSSFPANSAAVAFAIAMAVLRVNRRVGLGLFLLAGLYGFARVYAGVHYPLDIVFGAAIGIGIAALVARLAGLLEPLPTMVIRAARMLCLA